MSGDHGFRTEVTQNCIVRGFIDLWTEGSIRVSLPVGNQQLQMLPSMVHLCRIAFTLAVFCISLLPRVQANQPELGWFTAGVLDAGQVPTCRYCINAFGDERFPVPGQLVDWNRTVGLYRCDGAQANEVWYYEKSTMSIAYSILSMQLCLDAVLWESSVLKLRTCNSSVVTQQWKYEDHRLVNGLVDSNGQPFYLLAAPPDPGRNPSNQDYTYPLFIANHSNPSDQFSYTSNFTFLRVASFVTGSTRGFSTGRLLQISNFSADSKGQLSNGGFERTTILSGSDIAASAWPDQPFPSYLSFCGWVIDYGPIDYVNSGFLQAQSGQHSIHLNTHTDVDHDGSISQTFRTEVGTDYVLTFYMTGFPPYVIIPDRPNWQCSDAYVGGGARLQLQVTHATTTDASLPGLLRNGSSLRQDFTANVTSLTATTVGASWTQQTVSFKASANVTTISFSSLNFNGSCGPMVDTVEVRKRSLMSLGGSNKVVLAVVGSVGGLAGLILAIIATVYGIRAHRERKYYSHLYKIEHARQYSVQELRRATKKFCSVLGEGGYGTVYKADFPDGTLGAVKVEKPRGPTSSTKVRALDEIAVLLRVHHRSLVNLIGFGIHKGRHMLVFEYLPNGNLHDRLHQSVLPSPPDNSTKSMERQAQRNMLPWKQRVKIAADIAYGLEYLHHEADPPIVHRDVKSKNILLTATDAAKLADFGLSKAAPTDATTFQSIETVVKGSFGYLDPQYFLTGVFSPKSDVYSFGVVLLELISGHQAIYNAASLASWAAPYLHSPSLYHELVDKTLNGDFNAHELEILVDLSKLCMQEDAKLRPNMRQVVSHFHSTDLPSMIFDEEGSEPTDHKNEMESSSGQGYREIYEILLADVGEPRPREATTLSLDFSRGHGFLTK